jgi:hypothetical protein
MGGLSANHGRTVSPWDHVSSEQKPQTVRSTTTQKHTVPAQIHFGRCGRSADPGRMVRAGTQGHVRQQTPLVESWTVRPPGPDGPPTPELSDF